MYEIKAQYKGLAHIMQDRFADPTATEKPQKKKKKGKNENEVYEKLHTAKGYVIIPADNIYMMLIGNKHRRGAAQILGSDIESGKGTKYKSMCEGCIWVLGADDPMYSFIQTKRKTYDEIDERSFINANGSRSMAYRPIIKMPWTVDFIIQVTDDNIEESFVRQLFDTAGLRCGICAYGPKFGRCIISNWDVQK